MSDVDFEARLRYRRGADLHDLMDDLIVAGFSPEVVEEAVMRVHRRIAGEDRRRGAVNVVLGLLLLVAGGGFGLWALLNGLFLLVAWVAAVAGGTWLLVGTLQVFRAGKDRGLAQFRPLGG